MVELGDYRYRNEANSNKVVSWLPEEGVSYNPSENKNNSVKDSGIVNEENVTQIKNLIDEAQRNNETVITYKNKELIPDLLAKFQQRFGDRLQGQNSDPTYIEVMAAGVSKASSMLKLAELFGVEQKDILAIGDSGNDVDMIKAAGVGVAVANARPSAMEAARYHVGANVDNGVAEAIDRFFYGR